MWGLLHFFCLSIFSFLLLFRKITRQTTHVCKFHILRHDLKRFAWIKSAALGFGLIISMFITTLGTIKQKTFVIQMLILEGNIEPFPYGCKSFYLSHWSRFPNIFLFICLLFVLTVFGFWRAHLVWFSA